MPVPLASRGLVAVAAGLVVVPLPLASPGLVTAAAACQPCRSRRAVLVVVLVVEVVVVVVLVVGVVVVVVRVLLLVVEVALIVPAPGPDAVGQLYISMYSYFDLNRILMES